MSSAATGPNITQQVKNILDMVDPEEEIPRGSIASIHIGVRTVTIEWFATVGKGNTKFVVNEKGDAAMNRTVLPVTLDPFVKIAQPETRGFAEVFHKGKRP